MSEPYDSITHLPKDCNDGQCKDCEEEEYPIRLAGMILGGRQYWCTVCQLEVKGFNDKQSAVEFRSSGMCQDCQDKVFHSRKD